MNTYREVGYMADRNRVYINAHYLTTLYWALSDESTRAKVLSSLDVMILSSLMEQNYLNTHTNLDGTPSYVPGAFRSPDIKNVFSMCAWLKDGARQNYDTLMGNVRGINDEEWNYALYQLDKDKNSIIDSIMAKETIYGRNERQRIAEPRTGFEEFVRFRSFSPVNELDCLTREEYRARLKRNIYFMGQTPEQAEQKISENTKQQMLYNFALLFRNKGCITFQSLSDKNMTDTRKVNINANEAIECMKYAIKEFERYGLANHNNLIWDTTLKGVVQARLDRLRTRITEEENSMT